jgi:hypothetical protein
MLFTSVMTEARGSGVVIPLLAGRSTDMWTNAARWAMYTL